jgi:hypothetical protein
LSDLKKIDFNKSGDQKIIFKTNDLQIIIETNPFVKADHQLQKLNNGELKIDNKIKTWGFSGQIPKNEIKSIQLKSKRQNYFFPKAAIVGLYEIIIDYTEVYIGKNDEIFIAMKAADGSESYEMAWCLKNNKLYAMTVMQTIP